MSPIPLIGILSQSAILFGLILVITRLAPNIPARVQSCLWLLFFAHLVVAPFYTYPLYILPESPPIIFEASSSSPITSQPIPINRTPAHFDFPWAAALWTVGTSLIFGYGMLTYRASIRHIRAAQFAPLAIANELTEITRKIGLKTLVRLKVLSSSVPCAIGFNRPIILIPESLLADSESENRLAVLAHEATHIKHRDAYVALCLAAVRAIYFFFPCVWWAFREWSATRECVCDAAVLDNLPISPARYSRMLFSMGCQPRLSSLAQAFSNDFRQLHRRINHMKNKQKNRGAASLAAIATLIVVGLAAIPMRLAQQSTLPGYSTSFDPGEVMLNQNPGTYFDPAQVPSPADNLLETPVTVDMKQAKLEDIAKALSNAINFKVTSETRRKGLTLSLSAKEAPLKELLETICQNSGLKWARYQDRIEITDK